MCTMHLLCPAKTIIKQPQNSQKTPHTHTHELCSNSWGVEKTAPLVSPSHVLHFKLSAPPKMGGGWPKFQCTTSVPKAASSSSCGRWCGVREASSVCDATKFKIHIFLTLFFFPHSSRTHTHTTLGGGKMSPVRFFFGLVIVWLEN